MARVCATTAQRELVSAAGAVLAASKSNILLARNTADVAHLLAGSGGGGGGAFAGLNGAGQ